MRVTNCNCCAWESTPRLSGLSPGEISPPRTLVLKSPRGSDSFGSSAGGNCSTRAPFIHFMLTVRATVGLREARDFEVFLKRLSRAKGVQTTLRILLTPSFNGIEVSEECDGNHATFYFYCKVEKAPRYGRPDQQNYGVAMVLEDKTVFLKFALKAIRDLRNDVPGHPMGLLLECFVRQGGDPVPPRLHWKHWQFSCSFGLSSFHAVTPGKVDVRGFKSPPFICDVSFFLRAGRKMWLSLRWVDAVDVVCDEKVSFFIRGKKVGASPSYSYLKFDLQERTGGSNKFSIHSVKYFAGYLKAMAKDSSTVGFCFDEGGKMTVLEAKNGYLRSRLKCTGTRHADNDVVESFNKDYLVQLGFLDKILRVNHTYV
jgi:hypothetical protein